MPAISVYFAADFGRHPYVEEVARSLEAAADYIVVISRWHGTPGDEEVNSAGTGKTYVPPSAREMAQRAIEDIRRCDTFVVFTTGEFARGGRHFETGLAYGLQKRIVVVGPEEHAFHSLPTVEIVTPGSSPDDTADSLAARLRLESP